VVKRGSVYSLSVLAVALLSGCGTTAHVDHGPPVVRHPHGSLVVAIASLAAPHTLVRPTRISYRRLRFRGDLPGRIVILNERGHLVDILHVKRGGTGVAKQLAPGHYSLRASPHPSSCGRQTVTVTPGHGTRFIFFLDCGYM
jgi:hypothetical protein